MGLSGSGKSTLIRTLNGLWAPTTGSVEILGTDIAKIDAAALRKVRSEHISMVFQHFALLPHRTVRDNASYALEIRGIRESRARQSQQTAGSRMSVSKAGETNTLNSSPAACSSVWVWHELSQPKPTSC